MASAGGVRGGYTIVHPGVDLNIVRARCNPQKSRSPVFGQAEKPTKPVYVLIKAFWYMAAQLDKAKHDIAGVTA